MKDTSFLLVIVVGLAMTSCATWPPSPEAAAEYQQGYNTSWEYAKKDAMQDGCFRHSLLRSSIPVGAGYQYHDLLREQGKSEDFVRGFKSGYEWNYFEFLDTYCGR